MRYYNADGGEAEMCGNGARCFARFAQTRWRRRERDASLRSKRIAGVIRAELVGELCAARR